ncbi:hypothetical protein [Nocardia donostiensis]|uniref:Low molecular weight antigen MTB12-like C-terminal domain-containing protein n=1 Tax=Nocardia donostiensis TaxID=1538463 RepID=A0A1V2TE66_9NOCA|nr:hypothetical protein [Nocardia donostiensis]ONM47796.1 hypothetical protein B0T46_16285 [Nocardia donostiensis]OQS13727.1 hypothetical protein B0T36_18620 [Nocardia donostiensis]OQS22548.1 hypothetical protein B0T44_05345 [Nocardia donostiensis]
MKIRPFRVVAAVTMAAAALTFTACSSDDSSSADSAAPTSQAAGEFESGKSSEGKEEGVAPAPTTPPNLPKPTAEELNDKINRALDSAVSEEEKLTWIEDAEQDPQLVDKLVEAAKKNNVEVKIVNVGEPKDGKLKADAEVTIDGSPVENASVDFVAEGDQWKIAHQFACNIVKSAQLDSAACQPTE